MSSTPRQTQAKKQAYVIEFHDEDVSMKHSHSFSNNTSPPESHGVSRRKSEKARSLVQSGEQSVSSYHAPTHRYTKGLDVPLRREKSDLEASSFNFSSRSASSKPFGSVGRRSRLAMDFVAEFLKSNPVATSEKPSSALYVAASSPPRSVVQSHALPPNRRQMLLTSTPTRSTDVRNCGSRQEEEDSLSDAGTYTIETEGPDKELDDARKMIDQVGHSVQKKVLRFWVLHQLRHRSRVLPPVLCSLGIKQITIEVHNVYVLELLSFVSPSFIPDFSTSNSLRSSVARLHVRWWNGTRSTQLVKALCINTAMHACFCSWQVFGVERSEYRSQPAEGDRLTLTESSPGPAVGQTPDSGTSPVQVTSHLGLAFW